MRFCLGFVLLAAFSCDSGQECDCEGGKICLDGECRQVCAVDPDCPEALSCVNGTCSRVHDECEADYTCTEKGVCRTVQGAFCQGGRCHYHVAPAGEVCPLDGEDDGDAIQQAAENWTGNCSGTGECRACDSPDDDCQLVFLVQPSSTLVGEIIDPAVEVQVRDKAGNLLDLGPVEIQIQLEADTGAVSGTVVSEASSGTARFSSLRVDSAGEHQLRATRNGVFVTSDSFSVQSSCSPDLDNYWPLTEDGMVYTDSVSAYNAACVDPTCPSQNGSEGALEFDGTDDGLIIAANDLAPFNWRDSESFSIELWMKAHEDSCVGGHEVVVGREGGDPPMHWWMGCWTEASIDDGKEKTVALLLRDNSGAAVDLGGDVIVDQQWHHLVGVRDANRGRIRLHVDGQLVAVHDDDLGAINSPLDAALNLGWLNLNNGYHYRGLLSSVALYGRPLLDSEIRFHHELGHGANYCDHLLPRCGNGFVESGEECDDANQDGGDGCTAWCTRELTGCPTGMTSYWQLRGAGAHRFDDSWGGRHATCSRSWGYVEETKICPTPTNENGQLFDGTSMGLTVRETTPFDWGVDQSFTIEFWMKGVLGKTCMPDANNEVIVGRDDPGNPTTPSDLHWWVGCQHENGFANFTLHDTGGSGDSVAGATINDGSWHHVVALHDAARSVITVYVDGVQGDVREVSFGAGFDAPAVGLDIGWLNLPALYFYHGFLDSLAIYSRALSEGEITSHHAAGRETSYCSGP